MKIMTHARHFLAGALMLACAAPLAQAQQGAAMLELNADGEIQIAPDGQVSDYRLGSKLPPVVADIVDRHVRAWRFEPIVVDGKPVVAKTSMHLFLQAEPVEGKSDYRLRVTSVRFGDMKRASHMLPPKYPPEAVSAHVGGKVLVAVRVDDAGNVIDAQAYQTSLDVRARNDMEAERYRRILEKASVAAARHWSYDITQTINGKPAGMSALVPVSFSLCNMPCRQPDTGDRWRALMPGPIHPAPWMHEQVAGTAGLSTLGDDDAMPLDSRFRLTDDIVGKLL
jgi:hypothetical protein